MSRYVISAAADRDLLTAFRHGIRLFGAAQALAYQTRMISVIGVLAEFPMMARERPEYSPPVRVHHHERHFIVYVLRQDHIRILRVFRDEADIGHHLRRT